MAGESVPNSGQIWNDTSHPWQTWDGTNHKWKDPSISWNDTTLPWKSGSAAAGGPFLLLADGASKLLLANGTDRLLITGTNPAGAYVPTFELLGF